MTERSEQVRAHVIVSGRVQGVFFRARTRDEARNHGVRGWVRNLPDDRVEAVFEGDRTAVQQVLDWCHRGPPDAYVDDVDLTWEHTTGQDQTFEVRW
jgi:acylphosphatase